MYQPRSGTPKGHPHTRVCLLQTSVSQGLSHHPLSGHAADQRATVWRPYGLTVFGGIGARAGADKTLPVDDYQGCGLRVVRERHKCGQCPGDLEHHVARGELPSPHGINATEVRSVYSVRGIQSAGKSAVPGWRCPCELSVVQRKVTVAGSVVEVLDGQAKDEV